VRSPASLLLLTALLIAVGCGDDGDSGTEGGAVSLKAGSLLEVSAKEYSFSPAAVVLDGPGELRIRLQNDGSLAHNIKLRRAGDEVGGTSSLPAGNTGSATVEVRPGRYELLCTVGDHAALGMTGELQVKE
jgi:plastocyanin